jgi:hypothetical protein
METRRKKLPKYNVPKMYPFVLISHCLMKLIYDISKKSNISSGGSDTNHLNSRLPTVFLLGKGKDHGRVSSDKYLKTIIRSDVGRGMTTINDDSRSMMDA